MCWIRACTPHGKIQVVPIVWVCARDLSVVGDPIQVQINGIDRVLFRAEKCWAVMFVDLFVTHDCAARGQRCICFCLYIADEPLQLFVNRRDLLLAISFRTPSCCVFDRDYLVFVLVEHMAHESRWFRSLCTALHQDVVVQQVPCAEGTRRPSGAIPVFRSARQNPEKA